MLRRRYLFTLVFTLLAAVLAAGIQGCGSGSESSIGSGNTGTARALDMLTADAIEEIRAEPVPDGVDPGLWRELTGALSQAVGESHGERIASTPPQRLDAAAELLLDETHDGLAWRYCNPGDYDQNGEVNASDLTPLAIHFGATGPFDPDSVLAVIDGDHNGELNLADITPIAVNFHNVVAAYSVCTSLDPGDCPADPAGADGPGTSLAGEIELAEALGDPTADRLLFEYQLDGVSPNSYCWVRPTDAIGAAGTPSNLCMVPQYLGLAFEQVDYTLHGVTVVDSPYGNVQVSYTGTEEPQYFNMTADGRWVIRNIPVLAFNGVGASHTVWMEFNLGVAAGTEKTELAVAAALTGDVVDTPPVAEVSVAVGERVVRIIDGRPSGGGGGSFKAVSEGEAPADEEGGKVVDSATHGANFPNQDCGDGQCAAAGVSNSLQFLEGQGFAIGANADPPGSKPIDIATVDGKIGATARAKAGWANVKAQWMKDGDYPVYTEGIPPKDDLDHEATAEECDAAMEALKEGKDVEMNGESHTAALVGMAKLDNGKYVMYVAHDTNQGSGPDHAGGTAVEKVVYDPNAPLPEAHDGYGFADGMINGFVVEGTPLLIDYWPHLNFERLYFMLGDTPMPVSGTGRCYSVFDSPGDDTYFNLVFNGQWVIRNMPVPRFADPGIHVETAIPFGLGVPDGTLVENISYGAELSTELLTQAPEIEILGMTTEGRYVMSSGETAAALAYGGPPAEDLWWFPAPIADSAFIPLGQVANQDCGNGECAPAAISNSLKTLKALNPAELAGLSDDAGSDTDDTDTDTMKPATGWDAGPPPGAPAIPGGGDFNDPDAWWNRKSAWMASNASYPITTELITNPASLANVLEAVRNGQDVELRVPGHVVMVVGVVELANGDFLLWVAHDTDQENAGGTVIEPVYYDSAAGVFRGAAWVDGVQFGNGQALFVVERVDVLATPCSWDYLGSLELGDGSEGDPAWVISGATLTFSLTHPLLGDVTLDPEASLEVIPPAAGLFTGGEFHADPLYGGMVELAASFHGTPAEPPSWFFSVYNPKPDSIYIWPSTDLVFEGDHVQFTVYCNGTLNNFLYLWGARVTLEEGNLYVPDSLNVGEPGGAKTWADGVWWDIDPPGGFSLPPEPAIVPIPLGDGRVGYDFFVEPLGGFEIPGATGALFNFEVEVHSDIHPSFMREDLALPLTHYGDGGGFDYYWASDDNTGAPWVQMLLAP